MKTGLVLEGGGMRGLFTAGVCDIFLDEHIQTDGIIGVSAGAAFGCNLKSGQKGRALRYNVDYCNDKRYCSFSSLLKTGDLFGAEFCYHTLPEELDIFDAEAFSKNPAPFYVVCTDVQTGKAIYHQCTTDDKEYMEWFRASASLPLVSRIVEVGGYRLLDGGIADSIPIKQFEAMGYEKNIVVLTQPKGYRKKPNHMMPLMKLVLRKYPALLDTLQKRYLMYNETVSYIEEKEKEGSLLVIRPKAALPLDRVEKDPEKLKEAHALGMEAAREKIEEIRVFLG